VKTCDNKKENGIFPAGVPPQLKYAAEGFSSFQAKSYRTCAVLPEPKERKMM